jgi:hypothetical protein
VSASRSRNSCSRLDAVAATATGAEAEAEAVVLAAAREVEEEDAEVVVVVVAAREEDEKEDTDAALTTGFLLVGVGFAGDLLEEVETDGLGLIMLAADCWPLTRPALLRDGGLCALPNLRDQLEVNRVSSAPPACCTSSTSSS